MNRKSENKIPVIAIFDIGKTNKKAFLFDEDYKIIYERSTQLPEIADEDDFACEDIVGLTSWVNSEFKLLQALNHVAIKAINVSAHGASFVHLDKTNEPVGHLYNYLKPFPEEILKTFLWRYNSDGALSLQTASPQLGSLNSGLQLYRLKHGKSALFNQIKFSLHLPQYISFLFSRKAFTELTSIGCHTLLWDFERSNYHNWVFAEKIDYLFPQLVSSDHIETNSSKIKVGVGLHDSSSALIPYLKSVNVPFALISTGTWWISLNPFNQTPLTSEELQSDCLNYISYEGKHVKASRLFAGYEHDERVKKIAAHFNKSTDFHRSIHFDSSFAEKLKMNSHHNPIKTRISTSFFDQRDLVKFNSVEEAYHQLMIDLIQQLTLSTHLVLKNTTVKNIFVDGGFSNNEVFMNLLALALPQYSVFGAYMPQASALGVALVIHHHWNSQPIPNKLIQVKKYAC